MRSSLGDTTLVTAPAVSSAARGSLSSDCSKPSVTRIATLTFTRLSIVLLLGSMTTRPKGATVMPREENWRRWEPVLDGDQHEGQGGSYDREEPDHRDHLHVRARAQGFSTTLMQPSFLSPVPRQE